MPWPPDVYPKPLEDDGLCGNCHSRQHLPGDWLCGKCRRKIGIRLSDALFAEIEARKRRNAGAYETVAALEGKPIAEVERDLCAPDPKEEL